MLWKVLEHCIGNRIVFPVEINPQAVFEKLAEGDPVALGNTLVLGWQDVSPLEISVFGEHIASTRITHRGDIRSGIRSNANGTGT